MDYVNFAKKVSTVLYDGQNPLHNPAFFKELLRDISKHNDAIKIKVILDSVTALYNEKVREEKEREKTGNKNKSAKTALKGAGK